jgi:hypothetical protein
VVLVQTPRVAQHAVGGFELHDVYPAANGTSNALRVDCPGALVMEMYAVIPHPAAMTCWVVPA